MKPAYYKASALESIARKVLTNFRHSYLNEKPQAVPIEKIIEDKYGLTIDYMRLTVFGDELGRMIYDDGYSTYFNTELDDYSIVPVSAGTMLIESTLLDNPKCYGRYRFTLAHELSHWILHKNLFTGTKVAAASYGTDKIIDDSVEWQANHLAMCILMPIGQVKNAFYGIANEPVSQIEKIEYMSSIFEVSKQAMEIRLKQSRLLVE